MIHSDKKFFYFYFFFYIFLRDPSDDKKDIKKKLKMAFLSIYSNCCEKVKLFL